jgi:glutathione S-transferase
MPSSDEQIKLKLYYFDLRAQGEVIRFLLSHSGMEWEDCVVSFKEWVSGRYDKDFLPVGLSGEKKLPVLSIAAGNATELMPETHDIAMWIAGQCEPSLLGPTPEMQSKAERIFEYCSTVWSDVDPVLNLFPVTETSPHITSIVARLPEVLGSLSKEIEESTYVCGSELTYVDLAVFHVLDNLSTLLGEDYVLQATVSGSPIRMFYDQMYSLPAISRRLMERPLAGSGQVGKEGSILYTTVVPSKLDIVRAALDIEYTSNVHS